MRRKVWFGTLPLGSVFVALACSLLVEPVPTRGVAAEDEKPKGEKGTLCPLYKISKQGGYYTYYAEICDGSFTHYDTTVDGTSSCKPMPGMYCVAFFRTKEEAAAKARKLHVKHYCEGKLQTDGITPGAHVPDPVIPGSGAELLESRIVKCYTKKNHSTYAAVSLYTALVTPPSGSGYPQRIIRWGIEVNPNQLPVGAEEFAYKKLKKKKGKKAADYGMADGLSDFQIVLGQEPEDP